MSSTIASWGARWRRTVRETCDSRVIRFTARFYSSADGEDEGSAECGCSGRRRDTDALSHSAASPFAVSSASHVREQGRKSSTELNPYSKWIRTLFQDVVRHSAAAAGSTADSRHTGVGTIPPSPSPSLTLLLRALLDGAEESLSPSSSRLPDFHRGSAPQGNVLHPLLCLRLLTFFGPSVQWTHPHPSSSSASSSSLGEEEEEAVEGWGSASRFPLLFHSSSSSVSPPSSPYVSNALAFHLDDRAVKIMTHLLLPLVRGGYLGEVQFTDAMQKTPPPSWTPPPPHDEHRVSPMAWNHPLDAWSSVGSAFPLSSVPTPFSPPVCTLFASVVRPHPRVAPHLPLVWEWLWALDVYMTPWERKWRRRVTPEARNATRHTMFDRLPPSDVATLPHTRPKKKKEENDDVGVYKGSPPLVALPFPLRRSQWVAHYVYFLQSHRPLYGGGGEAHTVDASSPVSSPSARLPALPPLRHVVPLLLAEEILPALDLFSSPSPSTALPSPMSPTFSCAPPPHACRSAREEGLFQILHHLLYVWWWREKERMGSDMGDFSPPFSLSSTSPSSSSSAAGHSTVVSSRAVEPTPWWRWWLPIGDALWWGHRHLFSPSCPRRPWQAHDCTPSLVPHAEEKEEREREREGTPTTELSSPYSLAPWAHTMEEEEKEQQKPFPPLLFARIGTRAVQQPLLYHPLLRRAVERVRGVFASSWERKKSFGRWAIPVSIPDDASFRRFLLLLAGGPPVGPSSSSSSLPPFASPAVPTIGSTQETPKEEEENGQTAADTYVEPHLLRLRWTTEGGERGQEEAQTRRTTPALPFPLEWEEWGSMGCVMPLYHFLRCVAAGDEPEEKGGWPADMSTTTDHGREVTTPPLEVAAPHVQKKEEEERREGLSSAAVRLSLSSVVHLLGHLLSLVESLREKGAQYPPIWQHAPSPSSSPPLPSSVYSTDPQAFTDLYPPESFALLPHAPRVHALKYMTDVLYAPLLLNAPSRSMTGPTPTASSTVAWGRPMQKEGLKAYFFPSFLCPGEKEWGGASAVGKGAANAVVVVAPPPPPGEGTSLRHRLWQARGRARSLVRAVMEEKRGSLHQARLLRRAATVKALDEGEARRGHWTPVCGSGVRGYGAVWDAGGAAALAGGREARDAAPPPTTLMDEAATQALRNGAFRVVEPAMARWYVLHDQWEQQQWRLSRAEERRRWGGQVDRGRGRLPAHAATTLLPPHEQVGASFSFSSPVLSFLWEDHRIMGSAHMSPSTVQSTWASLMEAQNTLMDFLGYTEEEEEEENGGWKVSTGPSRSTQSILDGGAGAEGMQRDLRAFLASPLTEAVVKGMEGVRLAGLLAWWTTARQWRKGGGGGATRVTPMASRAVTEEEEEDLTSEAARECRCLPLDRVANAALCVWHRLAAQGTEESERDGETRSRSGAGEGRSSSGRMEEEEGKGTLRFLGVKVVLLSLLLYRTHALQECVAACPIRPHKGSSWRTSLGRRVVERHSVQSLLQAIAAVPSPQWTPSPTVDGPHRPSASASLHAAAWRMDRPRPTDAFWSPTGEWHALGLEPLLPRPIPRPPPVADDRTDTATPPTHTTPRLHAKERQPLSFPRVYYPPMNSQRPSSRHLFASFARRSFPFAAGGGGGGTGAGGGTEVKEEFIRSFHEVYHHVLHESCEKEAIKKDTMAPTEAEDEEVSLHCVWLGTPSSICTLVSMLQACRRRPSGDSPAVGEGISPPPPPLPVVVLLVALPWSTVAERLSLLRLYDEGGASEKRQDTVDVALAQLFAFATPHHESRETDLWIPWMEDENHDWGCATEVLSSCETPSPIRQLAQLKVAVRLVSFKEELLHVIPAGPWKNVCGALSIGKNSPPNDASVDHPVPSLGVASSSSSSSSSFSACPTTTTTSPPFPSFSTSASSSRVLFNANALPPSLQLFPDASSSSSSSSAAIDPMRTDTRARSDAMVSGTNRLSSPAPSSVPSPDSSSYFVLPLSSSLEFISIGFPTRVEECAWQGCHMQK